MICMTLITFIFNHQVNLDAHLINDLGLDSLDVVEVVMAFEDEFGNFFFFFFNDIL